MSDLREMLREELARARDELEPELIDIRRNLHREPELRFEEYGTAQKIEGQLRPLDISVRSGVAGTGLLADLRGERSGPVLALRADMDALPIQDAKDAPYASRRSGVMHACGHDAHMTIACGVLRVMEPLRAVLPGTLRVIFQPGEEIPAGEKSGAQEVIRAGALEDPEVEAIFGMHVWPELPVGVVGLQPGVTMAAAEGRVLVTANIRDFEPLLREWAGEGRSQSGVILVPSTVRNEAFSVLISGIQRTLAGAEQAAWADRVAWLQRA